MMERALKERITGAIVLVIFAVLVVPIFLDGEKDTITTETVLLPGQEEQDMKTVTLNRERSEPIPVANNAENESISNQAVEAREPAPQPVVKQESARDEQEPIAQPETPAPEPPVSTTGMWAVQLGSFSNKQNAETLAADLRKQGYMAFLSQVANGSGQLHRVRIGPQEDRSGAEAMAATLLKVGHKGQVVPHP